MLIVCQPSAAYHLTHCSVVERHPACLLKFSHLENTDTIFVIPLRRKLGQTNKLHTEVKGCRFNMNYYQLSCV